MADDRDHSIAAPSSLHRTRQCPGSITMQRAYPEDPTSEAAMAAAEGTAAHHAMAEQMVGRLAMLGDQAPNGVFLTQEMLDAADMIVEDVRTFVPIENAITESPVDIKRIHPECWGTPDIRAWLNTGPRRTLAVWDLKFGYRFVPAFENEQLLAYAFGAIDQAGFDPATVDVIARIVQPRSYGNGSSIREWRFRASDMLPMIDRLRQAVAEALGPEPRTHVGPACWDCRARRGCEAYQHAAEDAMDEAGRAMPHDLPPAALGVELRNITRMLELLEGRHNALQEQAIAVIRSGKRVPHWTLETGPGRRVWSKPDAQVILAGKMLGVDVSKPAEAITPNQAVDKGFPEQLLEGFTTRKGGAAKLKLDDGSEARRIFGVDRSVNNG